MKKLLLLSMLLVAGCSSTEPVEVKKPTMTETEIMKRQDEYEFDSCVGISEGDISRCENFEVVCYIAHNALSYTNSISCYKK